jgi:S-adenosyl methyltransferase
VVYVDYDPVVLAHSRALLTSSESGATAYIDADIRDTSAVLDRAAEVLDFTKPVAVMLLAVLYALPDDEGDPYAIVARLLDAVPSPCLIGEGTSSTGRPGTRRRTAETAWSSQWGGVGRRR